MIMSFWKIAWRNMQQRALASSLTALSMALGVAVMIAVIVIHSVTVRQFEQDAQGYHVIVGGKGGALQLVLSTVYHVGKPLYPIPYTYYQKFLPGGEFARRHGGGDSRVPGRQLRGAERHAVSRVGTTPDLFDKIHYGSRFRRHAEEVRVSAGRAELAEHRLSEAFHEAAFEAVVGSVVAAQSGLKLGDEIQSDARHRRRRAQARGLQGRRHLEADRHGERSGRVHQHRRLLSAGRACRAPTSMEHAGRARWRA